MSAPRPQGFPKIAAQLFGRPLAITQQHAEIMVQVFDEKLGIVSTNSVTSVDAEARAIALRVAEVERLALARDAQFDRERLKPYRMDGNIAVIEVDGVLVHKGGWLDAACGFVGYNYLLSIFEEAHFDPDVLGVWVEMNSPGGSVAGLFEFVAELAELTEAAGGKPIYVWVNEMACSAAYAMLSVCDQAFGPRTAMVGSIGCIATMKTINRALDKAGVDIEIFRSRPRKARGGALEAMDDETRAQMQRSVEHADDILAKLVSAGRGISLAAIDEMGGDWFEGKDALKRGLLDALTSERDAWDRLERKVEKIRTKQRSAA